MCERAVPQLSCEEGSARPEIQFMCVCNSMLSVVLGRGGWNEQVWACVESAYLSLKRLPNFVLALLPWGGGGGGGGGGR